MKNRIKTTVDLKFESFFLKRIFAQIQFVKSVDFLKASTIRESNNHLTQYNTLDKIWNGINPLNTKRRLLYLKTQFVPRSKNFSSRL